MPSRLGRLYAYSKDTAFDAQENFTTEALAMAIADDPRPMIRALRGLDAKQVARVGMLERIDLGSTVALRSSTQVSLPGGGWLDLVLEVLSEGGSTIGAVWLEVKIGAPESGDQLDSYERHARQAECPVWLITLAHAPLRDTVPNLTWNELYRAVRRPQSPRRSWRDFLTFLEEQNV